MRKTNNLLQRAGKILTAGVFFALVITGCWNGSFTANDGDGNVTVTIETVGRTLRPNDLVAGFVFDRVTFEFTKGEDVQTLTVVKPQTSGRINLGQGTWNIKALGFITIDGREYEAAQGSSSVTVGSGNTNVSISLQTGIFGGSPGVFSYDIGYPAGVTEAGFAITPLPDRFGYGNDNTGKTVDLAGGGKTGSFELLPGYYILTITAKNSTANTMTVWSELVHIYSGRETLAAKTFNSEDFTGTITLSGSVYGGELNKERVTKAVVTAFSDENFVNRLESVTVTEFSKMTEEPYYYQGPWSITVPSYFAGKTLYFLIDETLTGPNGTKTQLWKQTIDEVSEDGESGVFLGTSYVWGRWLDSGNDDDLRFTVDPEGMITVNINKKAVDNEGWGSFWRQVVGCNYPAQDYVKYVYEFDAWTAGGEFDIHLQYYLNDPVYYTSQLLTVNLEPQTFTIFSDTPMASSCSRWAGFQIGNMETTDTLYIKINSIIPLSQYKPPKLEGGAERFTATPTEDGIRFKVILEGLQDTGLSGLQFSSWTEERGDTIFEVYFWNIDYIPDSYEFIHPYVQSGKAYTFGVQLQDTGINFTLEPVIATGGRGEIMYTNLNQLSLYKDANDNLRFNTNPTLSNFDRKNINNAFYQYAIVAGTFWDNPAASWQFSIDTEQPEIISLVNPDIFPEWYDGIFRIAGKTCFSQVRYQFSYDNTDIYTPINGEDDYVFGTFYGPTIYSTPYTFPNVIPNSILAEPHPEGVKLTFDFAKIPLQAKNLYVYTDGSANFGVSIDNVSNSKHEVIYPFVKPNTSYTFGVQFEDNGMVLMRGFATVTTTNGGLGELKITNASEIGLSYSSSTKTASFNNPPIVSDIAESSKISERYWDWHFFEGRNWDDDTWRYLVRSYYGTPDKLVLDASLNPMWWMDPRVLTDKRAFISSTYKVVYNGIEFSTEGITSESFIFPELDPAEVAGIYVGTAFNTNSNLYLRINGSWVINRGEDLQLQIGDDNQYSSEPERLITWYIDGVKLGENDVSFNGGDYGYYDCTLSTSSFEAGTHYGLVVATINGTAFAKEFAFRVSQ